MRFGSVASDNGRSPWGGFLKVGLVEYLASSFSRYFRYNGVIYVYAFKGTVKKVRIVTLTVTVAMQVLVYLKLYNKVMTKREF